MGAQKKKAKFVAKGLLQQKIKQRNTKKKFQALKEKKRNRFERKNDAPNEKKHRVESGQTTKDESDMLDAMDVDEFLNADFLESDNNEDEFPSENEAMDDSSSEEEDESSLDPRYLTGNPLNSDSDERESDEKEKNPQECDEKENNSQETDKHDTTIVTMEILQKVEKECFETKSISGLRRLIKIFSDACRSSDAADSNKVQEITFDVKSSTVYNRLMVNVFRKTYQTFNALVAHESSDENSKFKVDERKWKKYSLVIRRFFSSAFYLVEQTTDQDVHMFVLRELAHYLPLLVPCPKTSRRMLKVLLKLWAKSLNANVCMLAFVRIRDLALAVPFPFLELCLKGIYVTYMRNTKFTNEVTLPHHILLGNCVVELYGLDLSSSYQHAFVYIRELAIAIRRTITSPGPDSFKAVLNWQFFNQLRVWTAVVCAYPKENQLQALVYPLSQLLFAVVRLSSTLRFTPLRFHCVKLLQQLALATNSFIPTSPALLEVLQLEPFRSSYKNGSKKSGKGAKNSTSTTDVNLELCVKLSTTALDDKRVHDQIIGRLVELFQRECDVYKFNVAFPELTVPLQLSLNKFIHGCTVPKWKAQVRGLSDSIKKRADWIRSKRSGLDLCPKDSAQLDDFLRLEREAAVKKMFEKDVSDMQEILDASVEKKEKVLKPLQTDGDKKKKKKVRADKPVDAETVAKVKKMSLEEFKMSVAQVDAADEVCDFNFSSDEE